MFNFPPFYRNYLERVVLDIPEQHFIPAKHYALLGENGAGKSTLLSMLTDRFQAILEPWQVGFLPQKPYPFAMKVRESLALGIPEQLGLTQAAQDQLITAQLATFDLTELATKRADRLSGGESQRLALARLLIVPRQVLLLDEPGNHLDRDRQDKMVQILNSYLLEHKSLLFITTHHRSQLDQIADEILVLDQGKLIFRGAPGEYRC
ncbi:MAG: ATP-binding cassette domain-containing protein [Eubacteriales bacterium]|nr:ATP-binding cassette domain-containing protein [Eubacteriales bacterium]